MESIRVMTGTKRYQSDALRSLHEVAKDLHAVGAIDKATMRDFDLSCQKRAPYATASRSGVEWRATIDEDGLYCFAVAL